LLRLLIWRWSAASAYLS